MWWGTDRRPVAAWRAPERPLKSAVQGLSIDRGPRAAGAISFFLLGFASLTIQTVLIREALFAFHGGEIALGLFFAVWLVGIGSGARLGTRSAAQAESDRPRTASGTWALGLALLLWAGWAQIACFRVHRHAFSIDAGGYLPALAYLLLLLAAVLPVAVLTGYLFPLGLRARGISPGGGYAWESFGSMAGGAWAALFALTRMPALTMIASLAPLSLAGLMVAEALGGGVAPRGRFARPPAIGAGMAAQRLAALLLLVLTGAGLAGGAAWFDALLLRLRWSGLETGSRAVSMYDTPYHHVTLAERGGEISLYVDGLYEGGIADPYVDSLSAAVIATQHPDPRRMLLLTTACHGAATVLATATGERLRLVREDDELDRLLASAQQLQRGSAGDREITTDTADPRTAVRSVSQCFDLIAVLHGVGAGGAANRLYTEEFFADCAARLAPGGVLVLSLPGAANVASPESRLLRAAVVAALGNVFREVRISPGTTHYVFAAAPQDAPPLRDADALPLSWNPDSLAARRARLWPNARAWPAALFARLFPPERVAALQAQIADDRAAGVTPNRDRRPLAFYEQLRRWDRLSGSGLGWLLSGWHDRPWRVSLWALVALALLGFGLRQRSGQAVVSLTTTGLVGMGADLILLLLFQTLRGTLYLRVGLIVALFMLGLGVGAWSASSWMPRQVRRAAAITDIAWVGFLLAGLPLLHVVHLLGGATVEALLFALTFLAGLLTGLPFPWIARALQQAPLRQRSSAVAGGLADAADHLGAVGGALLTGIFLVPLLGFGGALLFLAAIKLLTVLGWWLPRGDGGARAARTMHRRRSGIAF